MHPITKVIQDMSKTYQPGDRVRIVNDDLTRYKGTPGVNSIMQALAGQVVTIHRKTPTGRYKINEDNCQYYWSDKWFLPLFKSEEEIFESLVHGEISDAEYAKYMEELKK